MPGDCDRPFWDELCHAIIAYGGRLAGFLDRLNKRPFDYDLSDDAGPHVAHGTAKTSGARHRPALTKKISSCGVRSAEDGTADKSRAADSETVVQLLVPRHWSLPIARRLASTVPISPVYGFAFDRSRIVSIFSATISIVTGSSGSNCTPSDWKYCTRA